MNPLSIALLAIGSFVLGFVACAQLGWWAVKFAVSQHAFWREFWKGIIQHRDRKKRLPVELGFYEVGYVIVPKGELEETLAKGQTLSETARQNLESAKRFHDETKENLDEWKEFIGTDEPPPKDKDSTPKS